MKRVAFCVMLVSACSGGHSQGHSTVEVSLEGQAQGVIEFDVTVNNGVMTTSPFTFPLPSPVDIPPPQTVMLQLDSGASGTITLQVQALGSEGVVATGSGTGTFAQGTPIRVVLTPTSSGPPSLTGSFVAGAGVKTEGSVTLNGRFHWQGATMTATNGNVALTGWFR